MIKYILAIVAFMLHPVLGLIAFGMAYLLTLENKRDKRLTKNIKQAILESKQ